MERTRLAFVASLMLIGCNTESTTPPPDTTVRRDISAQLRSQCPGLLAARSSTDSLRLHPGFRKSNTVLDSIHDSEGKLVAVFQGDFLWSVEGPLYVPWDGMNQTGAQLPGGRYFHFVQIHDTTGALVRRDSLCMILDNGG